MGVMIQCKTHLLRQRYTLETLSYSKIHRILSLLGSTTRPRFSVFKLCSN
ncbi:hypothetical protein NC653_030154 [Populus alba x Populus x berolinensis]|uniref:Uncharacterized protein n=1 Tax=Populus alba x Populus x berolinensis TaxID=444605 RepID=A0AAD6LVC2_9ROSI|nr:hypothetical protein NC653_030154 [Populus alba x Populus x berolinensis]